MLINTAQSVLQSLFHSSIVPIISLWQFFFPTQNHIQDQALHLFVIHPRECNLEELSFMIPSFHFFFFNSNRQLHCGMSLNLGFFQVSFSKLGNNGTEMILHLSQCIISGSCMSICPIFGYVNFDHLVKVGSTKSLHYKFTIFLFLINK